MIVPTLLKLGSVLVAIASVAAAVLGWIVLSAVAASAAVAPRVGSITEDAAQLLAATDEVLTEVRSTLDAAGSVTDEVALQTTAVADVLEQAAGLSSEQIPAALESLEASLPALEETAAVLENALRALSVVGVPYDPEVPFAQALADLRNELEGVPEAIAAQGGTLSELVPDVRRVGGDTAALSGHLSSIDASLARAQAALAAFGTSLDGLHGSTRLTVALANTLPFARAASVVLAAAGVVLGGLGWVIARRVQAVRYEVPA